MCALGITSQRFGLCGLMSRTTKNSTPAGCFPPLRGTGCTPRLFIDSGSPRTQLQLRTSAAILTGASRIASATAGAQRQTVFHSITAIISATRLYYWVSDAGPSYRPFPTLPVALIALIGVSFYSLSRAGLIGPDEPRYASIGRAMASSGDWVTPRLWGVAWFEKPALLYWLIGAAHSAGLRDEWGRAFAGSALRSPVCGLLLVGAEETRAGRGKRRSPRCC